MSRGAPRYLFAIALHSTCHPGRPLPHGLGHDGSSPLDFFHRGKSSGSSFGLSAAGDSTTMSANFWGVRMPKESFAFFVRKDTSPSTEYSYPRSISPRTGAGVSRVGPPPFGMWS